MAVPVPVTLKTGEKYDPYNNIRPPQTHTISYFPPIARVHSHIKGGTTVTWAPTSSHLLSQQHNHLMHASTSASAAAAAAAATHTDSIKLNNIHHGGSHSTGTEIDRIMAKIEQARLSIANVCENKTTTTTLSVLCNCLDVTILLCSIQTSTYLFILSYLLDSHRRTFMSFDSLLNRELGEIRKFLQKKN